MPEGDEVAEPREVFWAEAKQSPAQRKGGTSQVDGKMEAQTKSGGAGERGERANQPCAKQAMVCAADFDNDEVLSRLVGYIQDSLGAIHLLRSQRGGGYPKANVVSEVVA